MKDTFKYFKSFVVWELKIITKLNIENRKINWKYNVIYKLYVAI